MRRLALAIIGGGLAALLFLVGLGKEWSLRAPRSIVSPTPVSRVAETPSPLPAPRSQELILVTQDENRDGQWDHLFAIEEGAARALPFPTDADRSTQPVTDGQQLYVLRTPSQKREEHRLVTMDLAKRTESIVTGATALVSPRGVFASPNGKVIAFYLDNLKQPLTELWTVNPQEGEKRLAAERLAANVRGPFWTPDGGSLLLSDDRLLLGSPNRTGVDILPLQRSWNDLLPGPSSLIPSPGGSQVVFLSDVSTRRTPRTSEVHVWDINERQERAVLSLPTLTAQFLGWAKNGDLLLTSTAEESVTLWSIRKGTQEPLVLGGAVSSLVLSGDGEVVTYLREEGGRTTVVTRNLETQKEQVQATLETESTGDSSATSTPAYTIVQHIRHQASSKITEALGDVDLAHEEIVRYVMEHIREIGETPSEEPVVAERVWMTRFPGVVLIDYRVGTTPWRRSAQIVSVGGRPVRHTVLGVYAPAAGEWVLTRGTATVDAPTVLYEFEVDLQQWVRKDMPQDIQP